MKPIEVLRKKIEAIDTQIIEALATRQQLALQIGQIKKQLGIDVIDLIQEKKSYQYYKKICATHMLPYPLVKRLFEIIIDNSREIQQRQCNKPGESFKLCK